MNPMTSAPNIHLRPSPEDEQRWFMDLEDVPESQLHAAIIQLLLLVLGHRFPHALVTTNLPCRWDPKDERIGVNPDVLLVEPSPPNAEDEDVDSLRVWQADHAPPKLAIEVVSKTNAVKDYRDGPPRHERLGTQELWLFDPELRGPNLEQLGGPHLLQVWRGKERLYAGSGPAHSPMLDAWVVITDADRRLRIADDEAGTSLWPTRAEAAEQTAEAANRRAEAAEAELRRLRSLLDKEK